MFSSTATASPASAFAATLREAAGFAAVRQRGVWAVSSRGPLRGAGGAPPPLAGGLALTRGRPEEARCRSARPSRRCFWSRRRGGGEARQYERCVGDEGVAYALYGPCGWRMRVLAARLGGAAALELLAAETQLRRAWRVRRLLHRSALPGSSLSLRVSRAH